MEVVRKKVTFKMTRDEAKIIGTFIDLLDDSTKYTDATWEELMEDMAWWKIKSSLKEKIFEGEFYDIEIVD